MAGSMKRSRSAKPADGHDAVVTEIVELVEVARRRAARAVNATMTAVYWSIGRRIGVEEQHGRRADAALVRRLHPTWGPRNRPCDSERARPVPSIGEAHQRMIRPDHVRRLRIGLESRTLFWSLNGR